MNRKQHKTLEKIFEQPTRADVKWKEAKSLLIAIGATVTEGSGSRIAVDINERTFTMHKPHGKELMRYQVRDIRDFFTDIGVTP